MFPFRCLTVLLVGALLSTATPAASAASPGIKKIEDITVYQHEA